MEHRAEEVGWYYKNSFPWGWFEEFITKRGHFEFGQCMFWFRVMGSNGMVFPCKERMQFVSVEDLKKFVIEQRVLEIHLSVYWPLSMKMMTTDKHFRKEMLERPLILDLDLTDMDHVRKEICQCVGEGKKQCCDICWNVCIEQSAIPFIRCVLEELCQFKDVLYVFSGRRGMHVHISDKRVLAWTILQRKAFMEQVFDQEKAIEMLTEPFERYIAPTKNQSVINFMKETYNQGFGGEQTIGTMIQYAEKKIENNAAKKKWKLSVIAFALKPRFDNAFTKDMTHLIKAPYTIHQDTKKICFPFSSSSFKPSNATKYTNILITK
jgi:DNA primase catalytic subunit